MHPSLHPIQDLSVTQWAQIMHHLRNSVMTCESVIRRFVDFFFCRETTLGGSSASVLVDGLDEFNSGCEGTSSIVTFLTELDKSSVGLG